ncbi:MAG TPA: GNAT family N-acetyltransferase [Aestuariivirgaceae bacterium]|nr:GNAT family N-acetyltransferase [Aestuariivirgaceae bacterium]
MTSIVIALEDPRAADVTALVRELDTMFEALYPAESNHLLDVGTLAGNDMRFFVVRRDGEALGCGGLWLKAREYGEVKRVFVRPAARGLKLGRLILDRLEAEARAHGIGLLRLETGIHQPEALGLFAAAGFRVCGAFGDYPADDPNSVFMEKSL